MRSLLLVVFVVVSPMIAQAVEYPCPSDPGFCYRDLGDDGCFDSGTDEGPINDEIEASSAFPAIPDPGSLVCPPSVTELAATDLNIRLQTPAGSDILFYAAEFNDVRFFDLISGRDVLLGGMLGGMRDVGIEAANDIVIERGAVLNPGGSAGVSFEAAGGDITVAEKARFKANDTEFRATIGNITVFDKVKFDTTVSGSFFLAGGDVVMTDPKILAKSKLIGSIANITIEGANVSLLKRAKLISKGSSFSDGVRITATSGDVLIDRLILRANIPIEISGANLTIGVEKNGRTPRSKIVQVGIEPVDVLATGTIDIDSVTVATGGDALLDTAGTTLNILSSTLKGRKVKPAVTVSAGASSTCDLTGTTVKSATLVTHCDTVVGP